MCDAEARAVTSHSKQHGHSSKLALYTTYPITESPHSVIVQAQATHMSIELLLGQRFCESVCWVGFARTLYGDPRLSVQLCLEAIKAGVQVPDFPKASATCYGSCRGSVTPH